MPKPAAERTFPSFILADFEATPRDWISRMDYQIYPTFSEEGYNESLRKCPAAGYDIIGIAVYPPHPDRLEESRAWTRGVFADAQRLAQGVGAEWMVVEGFTSSWNEVLDEAALYAIQAPLWEMVAEEYLAATTVPPVGFGTSLDLRTPGGLLQLEGSSLEDALRDLFAALGQMR